MAAAVEYTGYHLDIDLDNMVALIVADNIVVVVEADIDMDMPPAAVVVGL